MDAAIIIPARFASGRFPGKPLAKICGEEMILHVCRHAFNTGLPVFVATDDIRIAICVEKKGYNAIFSDEQFRTGTDRVASAALQIGRRYSHIINLQGDEPLLRSGKILRLVNEMKKDSGNDRKIYTLIEEYNDKNGLLEIQDSSIVKVVVNYSGEAMYFSRNPIPWHIPKEDKKFIYKIHLGIYGYRFDTLQEITRLRETETEKAEGLEQLRWLEYGYPIKTVMTEGLTIGVDLEADIRKVEKILGAG